jgi:hypothetical protein
MRIIVTHTSPDWDAIGGVWLLRKFLAGWQEATVEFVPAGERSDRVKNKQTTWEGPIEKIGDDQIIHVDTGLGPLDHHQTSDTNVSGTGLTWDFIKMQFDLSGQPLTKEHTEAISRVVRFIVETDHFKEVFWQDPAADYHEFTLLGLLEGLKQEVQDNDIYYVDFGVQCLNAMVHTFESRIWAETEIKEKGVAFETKYGKAMGFETINDTVLKLAQKMGYQLVVRKDPRKGYVRIKALPSSDGKKGIDLTLAYEKLKKVDPDATWFLHVSKKMLLNGSPKNPKMRSTKLSLQEIISVLESVYK